MKRTQNKNRARKARIQTLNWLEDFYLKHGRDPYIQEGKASQVADKAIINRWQPLARHRAEMKLLEKLYIEESLLPMSINTETKYEDTDGYEYRYEYKASYEDLVRIPRISDSNPSQLQLRTIESETKDVESETKDVESETKDVESETKDIESETKDVESETKDIESETKDIEEDRGVEGDDKDIDEIEDGSIRVHIEDRDTSTHNKDTQDEYIDDSSHILTPESVNIIGRSRGNSMITFPVLKSGHQDLVLRSLDNPFTHEEADKLDLCHNMLLSSFPDSVYLARFTVIGDWDGVKLAIAQESESIANDLVRHIKTYLKRDFHYLWKWELQRPSLSSIARGIVGGQRWHLAMFIENREHLDVGRLRLLWFSVLDRLHFKTGICPYDGDDCYINKTRDDICVIDNIVWTSTKPWDDSKRKLHKHSYLGKLGSSTNINHNSLVNRKVYPVCWWNSSLRSVV
jgi:hypothetical protein